MNQNNLPVYFEQDIDSFYANNNLTIKKDVVDLILSNEYNFEEDAGIIQFVKNIWHYFVSVDESKIYKYLMKKYNFRFPYGLKASLLFALKGQNALASSGITYTVFNDNYENLRVYLNNYCGLNTVHESLLKYAVKNLRYYFISKEDNPKQNKLELSFLPIWFNLGSLKSVPIKQLRQKNFVVGHIVVAYNEIYLIFYRKRFKDLFKKYKYEVDTTGVQIYQKVRNYAKLEDAEFIEFDFSNPASKIKIANPQAVLENLRTFFLYLFFTAFTIKKMYREKIFNIDVDEMFK